ncbi:hypothetical protein H2203_004863 [Taxawa tesnikishii (nom. ined.)]|nr:hypothetical protein H2203_004863 [Dothideales sp. JES 119]
MPAKAKGKAAPSRAPAAAAAQQPATRPDWPQFMPLLSTSDLALDSLLPGQIMVISNFWTSKLCANYVSFLSSLPLVTTPGKPKRGDAVRVNDRYQIDDPAFAQRLWEDTALKELVLNGDVDGAVLSPEERKKLWGGEVLGLNPNIRIYRYSKGQFFDKHCTSFILLL